MIVGSYFSSIALTHALRQSKAKELESLRQKDLDGVRKQRSKDDVIGDSDEHPFVKETIQMSIAKRKAVENAPDGITNADIEAVAAASLPAAVESSCDSLGSKGNHHGVAHAEVALDDVLSFEQRRKDILRMTREAEDRKKRFVAFLLRQVCVICG